MKQFKKWLVEMDGQQPPDGTPPVNGGITPSVPPDIASELHSIAQKFNDLLKKLGIDHDKGSDHEKGLGDKGAGDKGDSPPPGPPPSFQTP